MGCHFLLQEIFPTQRSNPGLPHGRQTLYCLSHQGSANHFCPLLSPSLYEIFPWYLIFLRSSLVFPILLFSSISLHGSLRKAFLSLLWILWNSVFRCLYSDPFLLCFLLLFFSQLFVRPPQTASLLFCISFPWGWSWSLSPVQCHEPPSIVHQAFYLSDLDP